VGAQRAGALGQRQTVRQEHAALVRGDHLPRSEAEARRVA
jgi:hypothetical protein